MTREEAVASRRRWEETIKVRKHDQFCLYSDGTIIPKYPCTCGTKSWFWFNVMK